MKIALDIRKIGQKETGSEIYVINLLKNLAKIDQENTYYLCTNASQNESLAKRIIERLPDNFSYVSFGPEKGFFWTSIGLSRFVRKQKIDLVHVEYITPSRYSRSKIVTTIHDISFKRHPEYILFKDRFILNKFIPGSLKRADKIITVSDFTRNEILKNYKIKPEKVQTIYNGVSKDKFKSLDKFNSQFIENLKTKYGLNRKYILHVSSLQPRKNVSLLIEAYRSYIKRYQDEDTLLVIGGKKGYNYDEKIDDLLRDPVLQKRIKLIGYIKEEELPAIYAAASLYVSPSIYEGFDLPVVEVMKSGVPVIASNSSCHGEILDKAGLFFDLNKKEELVDKINEGLNNQKIRMKLIQKGLKRAQEFGWEKCAKETLNLYKGAVA
jgi:glycosyltransferase involved in cell wall biosynthesis